MKPLYFLPGLTEAALFPKGEASQAIWDSRGLGVVARGARRKRDTTRGIVRGGPGGLDGLLLCFGDYGQAHEFGYLPARQTWTQLGDDLWVGIDNTEPPTPEDLLRETALPGHEVRLGEQVWIVPVIRGPNLSTNLPRVMKRDRDGEFQLEIRSEWAELWERSARMWDAVLARDALFSEVFDLTVDALGANYRVDAALAGVLELIDTENWEEVLRAAVDWPAITAFLEAQQKKSESLPEAGMASSTLGDMDATPSTPPAEPNCTSPPASETTPKSSCSGGEA